MTATIHPFERAGLGEAPFTFRGVVVRTGPIKWVNEYGTETTVGYPGQPMGACVYCGQGIKVCCVIEDRNGNRFEVGDTCVNKTYDKHLIDDTRRAVNRHKREAKARKDGERIQNARKLLDRPDVRQVLETRDHPKIEGKSYAEYADWIFQYAGNTGRMKVSRELEKISEQFEKGA